MPPRDSEVLQQLLAEFAASEQVLPRGRLPRLGRLAAAGARLVIARGVGPGLDAATAAALARRSVHSKACR